MATDDGRTGGEDRRDDRPAEPDDAGQEPTLLPYDWPEPATWDRPIGAAGEPLGDPAELVALDGPEGPEPAPPIRLGRRRAWTSRAAGAPRARLRGLQLPSAGALAASGAFAGLVTLIGLNAFVLSTPGGADPGDRERFAARRPQRRRTDRGGQRRRVAGPPGGARATPAGRPPRARRSAAEPWGAIDPGAGGSARGDHARRSTVAGGGPTAAIRPGRLTGRARVHAGSVEPRMRQRTTIAGALGLVILGAGLAGAPEPAVATDGSLYGFGIEALVGQAVPDGQCSVSQTGASFGVTCPPAGTSFTGTKWQIDLRTPVPGSVIEAFYWRSVRFHQTATSIAQQVLADGALAWQVAEADIPRSPPQPKAYQVGMRAFTASLRLYQTEARQQPNRVWTFLEPTILVRDVEAPSARWTGVPGGWITTDQARVEWQASDNFGSDGIGLQRISSAERLLYAGAPGAGSHAVNIVVSSLPDGVYGLRLEADGDGTGPAAPHEANLRLDRMPPSASINLIGLPNDGVRAIVAVSDATSGVRDWTLRARGRTGPAVASSSSGGDVHDIDLAALAAPGETIRFVLEASDNAGLSREVVSAQVTRPASREGAPTTTIVGGDGPLGEPGRIEASGAALPNFSRIETRGIRTLHARSYSRNGRLLVPFIAATYSRPVRVAGRFFHANRKGLRGATVYLVDPKGFSHATTVTDRRGRFRFRVRPRRSGTWRAIALGRPLVVAPAHVQLRPLVTTRVSSRRIRPGGTLRISGAIAPRAAPAAASS
jgi:hypothetical protein